jgi:hypothetical protein
VARLSGGPGTEDEALWRLFREHAYLRDRDRIIQAHLPLVRDVRLMV